MSFFRRRRTYIPVRQLPLGLYRASYEGQAAYGRTPVEARMRVVEKYEENRFRLSDIPNAILAVILAPFN